LFAEDEIKRGKTYGGVLPKRGGGRFRAVPITTYSGLWGIPLDKNYIGGFRSDFRKKRFK
jgi:hypothetical protein